MILFHYNFILDKSRNVKKGLKELTLDQLKRLQILVAKKDYSHSKKAHKSKMKLLARINVAIYETEEGREGI